MGREKWWIQKFKDQTKVLSVVLHGNIGESIKKGWIKSQDFFYRGQRSDVHQKGTGGEKIRELLNLPRDCHPAQQRATPNLKRRMNKWMIE